MVQRNLEGGSQRYYRRPPLERIKYGISMLGWFEHLQTLRGKSPAPILV